MPNNVMRTIFALAILLSPIATSATQPAPLHPAATLLLRQAGPADPAELAAFLDDFVAAQMAENHVAGAAVSVVKDGKLFLVRGYGYADVASQKRVDPEATLFRIASVTKLFTWTAVMQLVEQGKLDLDQDVNAYLDFKIPDTYPQPITLKHLMTHTSGLEDQTYDSAVAADSPERLMPLGAWLATHLPARVRPPGELAGYSNYGAALAGYIVERASGLSYDEYLEQHILGPLDMMHTTARQPLPERLASDMSVGYTYVGDAYQPRAIAWEQPAPAGAIWASATDMARFMIAHLQDGRYGEGRILEQATAQKMHSRVFAHDARLNGMAYGFYEKNENGQQVIGHGGDLSPFTSDLALLPDQGIGVFVTSNSAGGSHLRDRLLHAFLDHYYPAPAADAPAPLATSAGQVRRFAGEYRSARSNYTTLEKLSSIFGRAYNIGAANDGTLTFSYPRGIVESRRFYQIEPLLFREVGGDDVLLFREDDHGRITHAFLGSLPVEALERPAFYDTQRFNMALLGVINLLFLSVLLVLPARAIVRWLRQSRGRTVAAEPRTARWGWWLVVALVLLSIVEGGGVAGTFFLALDAYTQGNVPWFGPLRVLPIVLALLTLGVLIFTALVWQRTYWGVLGRIYYTLLTLAALAQLWFLYNSNMFH